MLALCCFCAVGALCLTKANWHQEKTQDTESLVPRSTKNDSQAQFKMMSFACSRTQKCQFFQCVQCVDVTESPLLLRYNRAFAHSSTAIIRPGNAGCRSDGRRTSFCPGKHYKADLINISMSIRKTTMCEHDYIDCAYPSSYSVEHLAPSMKDVLQWRRPRP